MGASEASLASFGDAAGALFRPGGIANSASGQVMQFDQLGQLPQLEAVTDANAFDGLSPRYVLSEEERARLASEQPKKDRKGKRGQQKKEALVVAGVTGELAKARLDVFYQVQTLQVTYAKGKNHQSKRTKASFGQRTLDPSSQADVDKYDKFLKEIDEVEQGMASYNLDKSKEVLKALLEKEQDLAGLASRMYEEMCARAEVSSKKQTEPG